MNNGLMDSLYMDMAWRISEMSKAERLHVGAVMVTEDRYNIISFGWNGQPTGYDNCCEDPETGKTLDSVLHAEENAILKSARVGVSTKGSILYVTHSPCIKCARMAWQSGVSSVHYAVDYRSDDGIMLLSNLGVSITKHPQT